MRFKNEFKIQPDARYFLENQTPQYKEHHQKMMEIKNAEDVGRMIHEMFGYKQAGLALHWEMIVHVFPEEAWLDFKQDLINLFKSVKSSDYLIANAQHLITKLESVGHEKAEEINKKRQP